ncbi:hypothetical protein ACFRMQ_22150 [Kitasatospora sp. NPDC056783]|uniref:hypothetical protein n=1 Tax=Kitasatospora sp. NPDC056783 TaxID=3345943 RepID=UPI003694FEF1
MSAPISTDLDRFGGGGADFDAVLFAGAAFFAAVLFAGGLPGAFAAAFLDGPGLV